MGDTLTSTNVTKLTATMSRMNFAMLRMTNRNMGIL